MLIVTFLNLSIPIGIVLLEQRAMVVDDLLTHKLPLKQVMLGFRYRSLPSIGKAPKLAGIVENLQLRPVGGYVFSVGRILVQDRVDDRFVHNLLIDRLPFRSIYILIFN